MNSQIMKAKIALSHDKHSVFCIKQNFVLNGILLLFMFIIINITSILKNHTFSIVTISYKDVSHVIYRAIYYLRISSLSKYILASFSIMPNEFRSTRTFFY